MLRTSNEARAMMALLETEEYQTPEGRVVENIGGMALDIMIRHATEKSMVVPPEKWSMAMNKLCEHMAKSVPLDGQGDAQLDCFTIGLTIISFVRHGGRLVFIDPPEAKDGENVTDTEKPGV